MSLQGRKGKRFRCGLDQESPGLTGCKQWFWSLREEGRALPFPMHSFVSTDFQQEGLGTSRAKTGTLAIHALQTGACTMSLLPGGGWMVERWVSSGKRESGTAVPGVKVDICGEWGLQVVSQWIPELVLTQVPRGTFAALEKGAVDVTWKNGAPTVVGRYWDSSNSEVGSLSGCATAVAFSAFESW